MDESKLIMGRPYGGVGILWKKELVTNAHAIKDMVSKRICAIEINLYGIKILVVNVCPVTTNVKPMWTMSSC